MIKHPWKEEKVTANQWAKLMVQDKGSLALYDINDNGRGLEQATEREIEMVERATNKQIERVTEFFKIENLL